jgi:hypothetical protein
MMLREIRLLQAAEAVVSNWEVYRDDPALPHGDGMACALERLDDALDPYHLPGDGGE